MTTLVLQNTNTQVIRPLQLDKTTPETSPVQHKKPSRNQSNLADISTINATRYSSGSPLSLAMQRAAYNGRYIKVMGSEHAASLQKPRRNASNTDSDTLSVNSYGSVGSRPGPVVINLEEKDMKMSHGSEDGIYAGKILSNHRDYVVDDIEAIKAAQHPHHISSAGTIVFKVIEIKFDESKVKLGSAQPYLKFKLGLNSRKTHKVAVEGDRLILNEDVSVKYTNQDFASIKVKGKGKLFEKTMMKVRVSVIEAVKNRRKFETIQLWKGHQVVGEMILEVRFQPKDMDVIIGN